MDNRIQFLKKVWHHAIIHSHELVVAFLVEGSKMNVIMLLLLAAAICISLAVQVWFAMEE